MRFMLYNGSKHDEPTQRAIAQECRIRGIEVLSENGPFGTVVVRHDHIDQLETLPGVTSVVGDPESCPYGQEDCEMTQGGICICGLPRPDENR